MRTRAGEARPTDAPYYLAIRFTIESGGDRLIEWFGTEHLPIVCGIPGVLRARLYETDAAISQILTEERKLYGAGPGKERFLVTYELTSPGILQLPAWRDAMLGGVGSGGGRRDIRTGHQDLFVLEFTIYPPHLREGG